ncbi:MAG: ABC transporter ATP-binding protein [Betaproteobacteria bacterium]
MTQTPSAKPPSAKPPSAKPPSAPTSAVPITIRGLTKTYGPVVALDNIDLDIRSGEFLTLLGPSGSGKTTLLMVMAGFIRPDHGSLKFGDAEVIRKPPHQRDLGMVFQNYALFPHMDVAANVAYPLKLRKLPPAARATRVAAALDMVQLGAFGARRIDELSGGQRQRVALARALVFEPRIVLMDEPLSALDKQLRERMQIELRQLHEKLGTTTVYVTHDQREALTMSDRIAVINGGRIMQLDTPRAIYDKPASRFVAEFIGESSFLKVEREGSVLRCAGQVVKCAASAPPDAAALLLMLRPERVTVVGDAGGADDSLNLFDAEVTNVVYQGDSLLLQAVLADGSPIRARTVVVAAAGALRPGQRVRLGLKAADTVLVADDAAPGPASGTA